MTTEAQPGAEVASSSESEHTNTNYRKTTQRFINSTDDARGYIALSIFVLEMLDRHDASIQKLHEEAAMRSDDTISITYQAAAKRILDIYTNDETAKGLDENLRENHLFLRVTGRIDEKYNSLTGLVEFRLQRIEDNLRAYSKTQSLMRQTVASAFGGAILTLLALIIVFGPSLLDVVRKALQLGG